MVPDKTRSNWNKFEFLTQFVDKEKKVCQSNALIYSNFEMDPEQVTLLIMLFPVLIIILLTIYIICKRRSLRYSLIQRHSKCQTCHLCIHTIIGLCTLLIISNEVVQLFFSSSSSNINIVLSDVLLGINSLDEFISFFLFIISAIYLQFRILESLIPNASYYFRSYHFRSQKFKYVQFMFYVLLLSVYIFKLNDNFINNSNIIIYFVSALWIIIVILFVYISYFIYFQPIKTLNGFIAHCIHDFVIDKYKGNKFIDTLNEKQIKLLISGWIRLRFLNTFYVPIDIQNLCANYIYHQMYQTKSYSLLSLDLIGVYETATKTAGFGDYQNINQYTLNKLEIANKRKLLNKIIGILMNGCIIIYGVRFVLNTSYNLKIEYILIMDIIFYICIWCVLFTNILMMSSNECIYRFFCVGCRYFMNRNVMKIVNKRCKYDVKRPLSPSGFTFGVWPRDRATNHYAYGMNRHSSLDSLTLYT